MPRFVWTLAALLAVLPALAVLPRPSQAGQNEQTDLQIQVVGLQPGSQRDVLVRVTNLSVWWSNTTVATVQTISPAAGQARTFSVPDLNTVAEAPLPHIYEFAFSLAGDCNGDVVKATLSPGTNYAGVQETNLSNNTDQRQVCPPRTGPSTSASPSPNSSPSPSSSPAASSSPAPSSPPGSSPSPSAGSASLPAGATPPAFMPQQVTPGTTGPARTDASFIDDSATRNTTAVLDGPALLDGAHNGIDGAATVGTHTVTVPWDLSRRRGAESTFHGGFHAAECYPITHSNLEPKFLIGWGEYEWFGSPCSAETYQAAMTFSLGALSGVPDYIVNRVVLGYDEVEAPYPICNGVIIGMGLEDPDIASNCWRSGGGKPEAKANGCVVVRVPSAEWRNNEPFQRLFPFITDARGPTVKQISPRQWDVTEPYLWQNVAGAKPVLTLPGDSPVSAGFGFLLTGGLTVDDLEGDDSTSCISWVTNVHLDITYTVPPDNGGFVPPR